MNNNDIMKQKLNDLTGLVDKIDNDKCLVIKDLLHLLSANDGDYHTKCGKPKENLELLVLNNSITIRGINDYCTIDLATIKLFMDSQMTRIRYYLERYLSVHSPYLDYGEIRELRLLIQELS